MTLSGSSSVLSLVLYPGSSGVLVSLLDLLSIPRVIFGLYFRVLFVWWRGLAGLSRPEVIYWACLDVE